MMVVCALPLPLVATMVALTPPPHDPAKQNTSDDQNPSALMGLATQRDPLRSIALVHSAAGSECAKNLQQDSDAHKNLMHTWQTLAESRRLGGEGLMGMCCVEQRQLLVGCMGQHRQLLVLHTKRDKHMSKCACVCATDFSSLRRLVFRLNCQ